jgi:hypothetical protein
MARKGLSELVVDATFKHHAVLLQYRTKCFRQGLTLPPQSKQENNATYVPFLEVSSSKTLLAVAKSCKKTCQVSWAKKCVPRGTKSLCISMI